MTASFTIKHLTDWYRNSDCSGEHLRQLLIAADQQIGTTFMFKMYWLIPWVSELAMAVHAVELITSHWKFDIV